MKRDDVVPLQGFVRLPDGSKEYHPARYAECPDPPEWMAERAKRVWRVIAREMHERAELAVLYTTSVEAYCCVVVRAQELAAAGHRAAAADMWHEADEWADVLLIERPARTQSYPEKDGPSSGAE